MTLSLCWARRSEPIFARRLQASLYISHCEIDWFFAFGSLCNLVKQIGRCSGLGRVSFAIFVVRNVKRNHIPLLTARFTPAASIVFFSVLATCVS
jgi:hypothetical protein